MFKSLILHNLNSARIYLPWFDDCYNNSFYIKSKRPKAISHRLKWCRFSIFNSWNGNYAYESRHKLSFECSRCLSTWKQENQIVKDVFKFNFICSYDVLSPYMWNFVFNKEVVYFNNRRRPTGHCRCYLDILIASYTINHICYRVRMF